MGNCTVCLLVQDQTEERFMDTAAETRALELGRSEIHRKSWTEL